MGIFVYVLGSCKLGSCKSLHTEQQIHPRGLNTSSLKICKSECSIFFRSSREVPKRQSPHGTLLLWHALSSPSNLLPENFGINNPAMPVINTSFLETGSLFLRRFSELLGLVLLGFVLSHMNGGKWP